MGGVDEIEGAVRVFAPASVSNVACGFDVLGFALDRPGDEITARRVDEPGVHLGAITGDGGRLPRDAAKNTATVAARALLEEVAPGVGVRVDVGKGMPLASGLGSSAASAVGAVVAVDLLLGTGLDRESLLRFALAGETVASGGRHADNLAPCLYGGFVLVRSLDPRPDVVALPVPRGLSCAVIRPEVEVETKAARRLLGERVALRDAVEQWGNVGALVAALFRNDLELLARSLHDAIAEPHRSPLVPGFSEVKGAALAAGALGCSLSGSGPAIFALCPSPAVADSVAGVMADVLAEATGLAADVYTSTLGAPGARRQVSAEVRSGDSSCAT
jgi:homoserine kinase